MRGFKIALLLGIWIFFGLPGLNAGTSNFVSRSAKKIDKAIEIAQPRKEWVKGERLVYDVSWMGVPVGVGELEISPKISEGGRDVYKAKAIARTNDVLSKLYPVEDTIESTFDATDFSAIRFRKRLSEGRYRADEETVYDRARKKGNYQSFKNGQKKEFDISPGIHDIVSAFFAFRTRPIRLGEKVHLAVSSEEKEWDVEIQVLSTERKEMMGQVLETVRVEPKTSLKGVLYSRGRVWVHYTADERRIPVLIQLKTPFGPVVGVLRGFDTL